MRTSALAPWVAWSGKPALATTFWTLHLENDTAQCVLYTHARGWELCLQGEHRFARSRVCRTAKKVMQTHEAWKVRLLRKGWRPAARAVPDRA
jgi:hypothetical protein